MTPDVRPLVAGNWKMNGTGESLDELKRFIGIAAAGKALSREEAVEAFDIMMSGQATPAQIGALLMALRVRGERVDEIAGAVSAMRSKMLPVKAVPGAIDIVGTGGDQSGSYNVSTCAAFVAAGAGVPVAKHGNRALSSRSGAADTLAALGINIEIGPDLISNASWRQQSLHACRLLSCEEYQPWSVGLAVGYMHQLL